LVSDRLIGIGLGVLLGIAVILLFLFLGSRNTIDEPSISTGPAQTQTQPSAPAGQPSTTVGP
jgi:hypothetical protein